MPTPDRRPDRPTPVLDFKTESRYAHRICPVLPRIRFGPPKDPKAEPGHPPRTPSSPSTPMPEVEMAPDDPERRALLERVARGEYVPQSAVL